MLEDLDYLVGDVRIDTCSCIQILPDLKFGFQDVTRSNGNAMGIEPLVELNVRYWGMYFDAVPRELPFPITPLQNRLDDLKFDGFANHASIGLR